jgi:hypothetical protein
MRKCFGYTVLCIACCTAFAQDAPRRKSGLWEISMSSPQMPGPMVSKQCVDEKTDDMSKRPARGNEKCSKQSVKREGSGVIVESVCQVDGSTATSRGVFSGDFKSSYKGEMVTRFSPPLHGMAESRTNFQARLTGPCAAGQKPGEVTMEGMPGGGRRGASDPESARRMAEEMMRKYQK